MSSVDPFDFVTDADPGADGGDTVIWVWVTLIFIYCFPELSRLLYITFHTETDVTSSTFVLILCKIVFNFICCLDFSSRISEKKTEKTINYQPTPK